MASSLRLVTSGLVTRSFAVSSSRFLSIYRSYTTVTKYASYNQSWLRSLSPIISSIEYNVKMYPYDSELGFNLRGSAGNEPVHVFLQLKEKTDDEHDTLLIQSKASSDKKEEIMKDGTLKLPNKDDIMANIGANIIASYRGITTRRSWLYYDMFFDRSVIVKELCPAITMLSPINSFSLFKVESTFKADKNSERTSIGLRMPGDEKMKLTTQGLRVSITMLGVKRGDVKAYFDNDTFFIEGKTKKSKDWRLSDGCGVYTEIEEKHYITGIDLPEGIHKKHNMIKREMKGNVLYAIIACSVKKEELHMIKDPLKKTKSKSKNKLMLCK